MSKKAAAQKAPGILVAELQRTLQRLTSEIDKPRLSSSARRKLEGEVRQVVTTLGQFLNELDPIRHPSSVFDPSNPKVVGRFISLALVAQERRTLSQIDRFYGSGVYALYYTGDFPLYRKIAKSETPIYVGQAAPAVNNAKTPIDQGDRLCRRLDDHRKNIAKATTTLNLDDFEYRSLVVQSGWESAAEQYLIHLFRPIWNNESKILFGLGKHGDAAKTRSNKRSPWDTLHPGRVWAGADVLVDSKSQERIGSELMRHFELHPTFPTLQAVLESFVEELRQA